MFQADRFEVGSEAFYHEDGARWKVRVEKKERVGDSMKITLKMLAVERNPTLHNGRSPAVDVVFCVSEYKNAGAYAGWALSEF